MIGIIRGRTGGQRIRFVYLDLGNVLIDFDHELAVRQLADASGCPADKVRPFVTGNEGRAYETGLLDTAEFCNRFRQTTGAAIDDKTICLAASAIFTVNAPMIPLVTALWYARVPTGILSNTCDAHWQYLTCGNYAFLDLMPVRALSFRLGAMKPDPDIFRRAAELAGCAPDEIFYTDDIPGHVEAARGAGFDAEVFRAAGELAGHLRNRGILASY